MISYHNYKIFMAICENTIRSRNVQIFFSVLVIKTSCKLPSKDCLRLNLEQYVNRQFLSSPVNIVGDTINKYCIIKKLYCVYETGKIFQNKQSLFFVTLKPFTSSAHKINQINYYFSFNYPPPPNPVIFRYI